MNENDGKVTGPQSRRRNRAGVVGVCVVAACVAVAAIGWAVVVVFAPPSEAVVEAPYTNVEVLMGEVGSSISLNTVAKWTEQPAGANQAVGIVTSVRIQSGEEVDAGAILYEVGLRPVVVAHGDTPSFRDVTVGSDGADVLQVQQFLAAIGFYDGAQDGEFGTGTAAAVRDWQEALGIEEDGVVRAADLVFVPQLPARITLDNEVVLRGATLAGGEPIVSMLPTEPTFVIPATSQQATKIPPGTEVEIAVQDQVWTAVAAAQEPSPESADQVNITLEAPNGGPICGDSCALIQVEGQSVLPSRIITQPTVTGLVVPSAALKSSADGAISVLGMDGTVIPVTVTASARGMSVVEGVEEGARVRIPAEQGGAK
ncbi:peptidoglycan-binding domain-containing protein [Agromyces aureus]|uniref:Peptidoglycan binding-like domain-containing protein n=1 Tax=Agromyces aureus TaxID=453304 RepID=A0A191WAY8_9MICO|nr:peptidoglycan-binding domain-containing protein [Agromyces aureus]ANJ25420.1 hypothetical protein ATC03_00170 [Agromyces aureus]